MISTLLLRINLNLSNLTYELPRYAISPYTDLFGNMWGMFWGIFFGFMGTALYAAGTGDSRIYLVLISYLVGVGLIFGMILDNAIIAIFGLLLAFLISAVLYKVFVEART